VAKNTGASRTVSVKSQEHGRAVMATAKRDPVTGRILPRSGAPAKPAAPPAAAEREEETAPAAIPFRGRLSARRPRSSASRLTSPPPASSPKA
jgi:hypothetical protein